MKLSLIIPCFNEQDAIPLFYDEVTRVLNTMQCAYELLFVNDGSRDETLSILKGFAEKDEHVTYLSFRGTSERKQRCTPASAIRVEILSL